VLLLLLLLFHQNTIKKHDCLSFNAFLLRGFVLDIILRENKFEPLDKSHLNDISVGFLFH